MLLSGDAYNLQSKGPTSPLKMPGIGFWRLYGLGRAQFSLKGAAAVFLTVVCNLYQKYLEPFFQASLCREYSQKIWAHPTLMSLRHRAGS
jgi:hypothetical protein